MKGAFPEKKYVKDPVNGHVLIMRHMVASRRNKELFQRANGIKDSGKPWITFFNRLFYLINVMY